MCEFCVWCVCGVGGDVWVCVCVVCVVCVVQFGVGLGSECAAGGLVVFVYRHCVAVSRGNLMSPVIRTTNFYESILGYL